MLVALQALALLAGVGCAEERRACTPVPPGLLGAGPLASAPVTAAPSGAALALVPFDLPKPGVTVQPPVFRGATPGVEELLPLVMLDLAADGTLSFNGRKIATDDELLLAARQAHTADPSVRAVVRADRGASWGSVAHAMDLLKQAGIARLAFAVDAPTPP